MREGVTRAGVYARARLSPKQWNRIKDRKAVLYERPFAPFGREFRLIVWRFPLGWWPLFFQRPYKGDGWFFVLPFVWLERLAPPPPEPDHYYHCLGCGFRIHPVYRVAGFQGMPDLHIVKDPVSGESRECYPLMRVNVEAPAEPEGAAA